MAIDQLWHGARGLEECLRQLDERGELRRVKAIYLVPYFDNPCGVTMPLERRDRIVEIARRWSRDHRIHVIADEAYRELRYEGDDIPSMLTVDRRRRHRRGHGIILQVIFAGRSHWLGGAAPAPDRPGLHQKGNIDFGSPNFNQHLMAEVLRRGLFEPHLERIRHNYRVKLQAMLRALEAQLGAMSGRQLVRPTGGLYVWLHVAAGLVGGPRRSAV